MSSSSSVRDGALGQQPKPQIATLGWALRRAALGLVMLLVMVALGAWLLYASIDPDEAVAGPQAQSEAATPQR